MKDADQVIKLAYETNPEAVRDIVRTVLASQYKSLDDAAEVTGDMRYAGRGIEVWYMKPAFARDLGWGLKYLQKDDPHLVPHSRNDLKKTHVLLGEVSGHNLDDVWEMMQGFHWSPSGEANGLIRKKGLSHTSMSVGDVLSLKGTYYMVGGTGFDKLF